MPKIVFLPHHEICPEGAVVEAKKGESICDAALRNGLDIEHACEMSCACTTCHVHIREGFAELPESDELEEDFLDKAWGVDPDSRLSCQVIMEEQDLVVEIPKYAIVVGTESSSLSKSWMIESDKLISIPMRGKMDSLNLSVSAAIVIFEGLKQRNDN